MNVTARRIPELAQNAPVAATVLSTERIHNYNVKSLEQVAAITPGLIITRGNSYSEPAPEWRHCEQTTSSC
jgi:outer membrane receptor protein involved in Fe transport